MSVIGRVPCIVAALAIATGSVALAAPQTAESAVVSSPGPSVVVRIDPAQTSLESVEAALGVEVVEGSAGLANTYLVASATGESASSVAAAARQLAGVRWAEPDGATDSPEVQAERIYRWSASDPVQADSQYAGTLLQLDAVHQAALGAGSIVAVVDSGIQLLPAPHPDLAASISTDGADFVDGDSVPDDEMDGIDNDGNGLIDEGAGHGTHVAGIIHRVAPLATILPVRVLDSDGGGNEWDVAQGMLWAADHGADVVNLSLGMHSSASLLKDTTQALVDRGVVVVAAAGNDGESRNEFPAASRCAIGVTGTSSADAVSSFATQGQLGRRGRTRRGHLEHLPVLLDRLRKLDGDLDGVTVRRGGGRAAPGRGPEPHDFRRHGVHQREHGSVRGGVGQQRSRANRPAGGASGARGPRPSRSEVGRRRSALRAPLDVTLLPGHKNK